MIPFIELWQSAQESQQSRLAIGIAPRLANMPAPIARYDDPFLPFGRAIIHATAEHACAYVFDLASYLALGAAGAIALERTIPIVPRALPVILHGPFPTADYAPAAHAFGANAVTLVTGRLEVINAYTAEAYYAAFVRSKEAMSTGGHGNVGFFDSGGFELGGVRVTWVTEPIIYASGQDDFAEAAHQAAHEYRRESFQ